jgi:hypothetical protein
MNMNYKSKGPGGMGTCLIFFCIVFSAAAQKSFPQDFGFVISQKAAFTDGEKSGGHVEYALTPIPWFTAPLGNSADLYLSGGISAAYDGDEWQPVLEFYRNEIIYNPVPHVRLEIGRLPFNDCLSHTMSGLFDGVSARFTIAGGRVETGIFYTGLLYKKTAYIFMSPEDHTDYHNRDRYFASRRLAGGINWEHTSVFDSRNSLYLSGIFQFDLNGNESKIHAQYLEARFDMPLGSAVNTEFGFAAELAEETEQSPYAAFTASTKIQWLPPTLLMDSISAAGCFSSGAWNKAMGAFIPLSSPAQGNVLRPALSGIAFIQAAYTVRFFRGLSADFSGAYFFRTDTRTWYDPDMDTLSDSPLLGGEIYGRLIWAPFSDMVLSAGGGVFLPKTGMVFKDDTALKYRVELTVDISF